MILPVETILRTRTTHVGRQVHVEVLAGPDEHHLSSTGTLVFWEGQERRFLRALDRRSGFAAPTYRERTTPQPSPVPLASRPAPCPFCGKPPVVEFTPATPAPAQVARARVECRNKKCTVRPVASSPAPRPGADDPDRVALAAIRRWNHRAPAP